MFDKLIESRSSADLRPRRRYFVISSVVVGVLFVTAVIASLYAADIDLGVDEFDMAQMLAPITAEAPEPVQQAQRATTSETADRTTRQINMPPVAESQIVPETISTTPSMHLPRPNASYEIDSGPERDALASGPPQGRLGAGSNIGTGSDVNSSEPTRNSEPAPDPPPAKPEPPKRPVSIGVANGKATYLPKPPYPASAIAVGAQGKVDVQVTIDEEGKVISAKAVNGHPFLRHAAERAAWNARFTPTTLSRIPVKVTGVIVYNFTRN